MEACRLGLRLAFPQLLSIRVKGNRLYHQAKKCFSSTPPSDGTGRSGKYKEFKDEESIEILDVFEERMKVAESICNDNDQVSPDGLEVAERVDYLKVDEVVNLIKESRGKNLVVLKLPAELKYVDHLIIATCQSRRHIQGLGETIRKHAKMRLNSIKNVPILEGDNSEWIALDMGNICIHIMSSVVRETYDLESLWGVGPNYDTKLREQDEELISLLKQHSLSPFKINQHQNEVNLKAEIS